MKKGDIVDIYQRPYTKEDFEGKFFPIVWLREAAVAKDGRRGFYDQGTKTLYLFKVIKNENK